MASSISWPVFSASDKPLEALVKLSRYYGSDPDFVLAGGGITSVKLGDRLHVKGSGHALATIPAEGFVEMDRKQLETLLNSKFSEGRMEREAEFKTATLAARISPEKNQRPSVEALLHHLMPGHYIQNRAVEGCLVQAVKAWTFPKPPRAQPLTLPFRFDEAASEERPPGKAPPKR